MIFSMEYKPTQCPDLTVKINGSKIKQIDRQGISGFGTGRKMNWTEEYMKCAENVHLICDFRP